MGISLGGYYASRAAACEPRLKALVSHGVFFDWWRNADQDQTGARLYIKQIEITASGSDPAQSSNALQQRAALAGQERHVGAWYAESRRNDPTSLLS